MSNEAVGVEIRDLVKTFPAFDNKKKEIYAANHVSLSVKPGELVTLLGPSGCGKTSLLRMVAGFLMPSSGEIYIGNREVSKVPPNKRNVGMMFQSYALFPHLTVYDNVAYGLKLKRLGKQEIREKVRNILQLMQIEEYAEKYEPALSLLETIPGDDSLLYDRGCDCRLRSPPFQCGHCPNGNTPTALRWLRGLLCAASRLGVDVSVSCFSRDCCNNDNVL